jgi:hypothetical protein
MMREEVAYPIGSMQNTKLSPTGYSNVSFFFKFSHHGIVRTFVFFYFSTYTIKLSRHIRWTSILFDQGHTGDMLTFPGK